MNEPEREWTLRIAFGLVLVASILSSRAFQRGAGDPDRVGGRGRAR